MISRHRSCFVNQREFSDSVRQEVALLKQQRHESPFMYMLSGAYKYPELMDEILDPTRCHATGVLSNSGDPTKLFHTRFPTEGRKMRCGNLTLESWTGVPPLRHNTRVAVSLLTYRRQLTVCMRCEPRHFSTEHTSELLDRYVARITGKFDGES